MKKGQMFIVTMVFLTGLIFITQQILLQYSFIDVSEPFQRNDVYLLQSVEELFDTAIQNSPDYSAAVLAVTELHHWLARQDLRGFALELRYNGEPEPNLIQDNWDTGGQVLELYVHIVGPGIDTEAVYTYQSPVLPT